MSFQPFIKGWLLQKKDLGVGANAWKKRYYVMKDDSLLVFERPRDSEPKKQILLRNAKIARSATKSKKFEFSITTPKRIYYFRAAFEEELDEWIQSLNSGIQYATTRTISSGGSKMVSRPLYALGSGFGQNSNFFGPNGQNFDPSHHNGTHFLDRYHIQNYLTNPLLTPAQHGYYAQQGWQGSMNTDPSLSYWRSNQSLMSTSNSFSTLFSFQKKNPTWKVSNPRINAAAAHDRFDSMILAGGMGSNYIELVTINHLPVISENDVDYDFYHTIPSDDSEGDSDNDIDTNPFSDGGRSFAATRASIIGPNGTNLGQNGQNGPNMGQNGQNTTKTERSPPLFSTTFPGFRQVDLYNNATWTSGLYDELLYRYPSNKVDILSKNILKIPKISALDDSIRIKMDENKPEYFKKSPSATPMAVGVTWVGEICAVGTTDELIHVYKTPIINPILSGSNGQNDQNSTKLSEKPLSLTQHTTFSNPNPTQGVNTIGQNVAGSSGGVGGAGNSSNGIEQHIYRGGGVKDHIFADPKYQITLIHPYSTNANTFPLSSDWSDYSLSGLSLCPRQSNLLSSTSHCNIAIFDLEQKRPLVFNEIASSSPISCHAWSHSTSPKLAIANARGSIKIVDTRVLRNGGMQGISMGGGSNSNTANNNYGNNNNNSYANNNNYGNNNNNNQNNYGNTTNNKTPSAPNPLLFHQSSAHQSPITAIANNPLFTTLWASASLDGTISVWDERYDAVPLITFPASQSASLITSIAWSSSHVDWLHVGTANGAVSAYNLRTQPYHVAHSVSLSADPITLIAPSKTLSMSCITVDQAGVSGFMHYKPAFVDKYVWGACPPEFFDANPEQNGPNLTQNGQNSQYSSNFNSNVPLNVHRKPGSSITTSQNTEEDEDAWLQPYLVKNAQSVDDLGGGLGSILQKTSLDNTKTDLSSKNSKKNEEKKRFLTISRHAERFITRLMYIRDWSGAYSALCSVLDILWTKRQFLYATELLKRLSTRHSIDQVGKWGYWKAPFLIDQVGSTTDTLRGVFVEGKYVPNGSWDLGNNNFNNNNNSQNNQNNSQNNNSNNSNNSQNNNFSNPNNSKSNTVTGSSSPSIGPASPIGQSMSLLQQSNAADGELDRSFSVLGQSILNNPTNTSTPFQQINQNSFQQNNQNNQNNINPSIPPGRKSSYPTLTSNHNHPTLSQINLNTAPNGPNSSQNGQNGQNGQNSQNGQNIGQNAANKSFNTNNNANIGRTMVESHFNNPNNLCTMPTSANSLISIHQKGNSNNNFNSNSNNNFNNNNFNNNNNFSNNFFPFESPLSLDFSLTLEQDTIIYGPKSLSNKFIAVLQHLSVCSPPLHAVCLTQPVPLHDRRIEFLKLRLMIHFFYQRNQWLNIYTLRKSLCNHLDFSGELLTRQETYLRMQQQQQKSLLVQQAKGDGLKPSQKASVVQKQANTDALRESIQQQGGYTGATRAGTINDVQNRSDRNDNNIGLVIDNFDLTPDELKEYLNMANSSEIDDSATSKGLFNPFKAVASGTKGVLSAGGNLVWQGLKAGTNLVGLTKQNKVNLNQNGQDLTGNQTSDRLQLLYSLRPVLDASMLSKAVLAVVVYDHVSAITMAIMVGETLKQTQQFSLFHSLAMALLNPSVFYTNSPLFNYGVDSTALYFKNKILQQQFFNQCPNCGLKCSLNGAYIDPNFNKTPTSQLSSPQNRQLSKQLTYEDENNNNNGGTNYTQNGQNGTNYTQNGQNGPNGHDSPQFGPTRVQNPSQYHNRAALALRRRLTLDIDPNTTQDGLGSPVNEKNAHLQTQNGQNGQNGQNEDFSRNSQNSISHNNNNNNNIHHNNRRVANFPVIQAPHSLVPFALDSGSDEDDAIEKLLPQNVEYTNLSQSQGTQGNQGNQSNQSNQAMVTDFGSTLKKSKLQYANISSRIGPIHEDLTQTLTEDPFYNPAAELNLQMTSLLQKMKSKQESTRVTQNKHKSQDEDSIFSTLAQPQNLQNLPQNQKATLNAQSMASNLVAPELKLRAQSSIERDLRNPRIVIEQLTFLLQIFHIIKKSEIPLMNAFNGLDASGSTPNTTKTGDDDDINIPMIPKTSGMGVHQQQNAFQDGQNQNNKEILPKIENKKIYKDAILPNQSTIGRFDSLLSADKTFQNTLQSGSFTSGVLPQSLHPSLLSLLSSNSPTAQLYMDLLHSEPELILFQFLPDWKQLPIWNPYRRIFSTFDCSTCRCVQTKAESRQRRAMIAIEAGITTTSTKVRAKKVITQTGPDGKTKQMIVDIDRNDPNSPIPKSPKASKKMSKITAFGGGDLSVDLDVIDRGSENEESEDLDTSILGLLSRGCTPLLNVAIEHPRNMLKAPRMPKTLTKKLAIDLYGVIEAKSPFDTRKQAILTALPFFLYLHVLSQLDRHDVTIYAASRLISSFSGLPFAKALEKRLDDVLVLSVVDWLNTTCTANRHSLGDLGQLHNGACGLTSIIARSPSLPMLLEQNIPQYYRRLTGEIQEVLISIATDPSYIPDMYKENDEDRANARRMMRKNLREGVNNNDENNNNNNNNPMSLALKKAKYNDAVTKANALSSAISQIVRSGSHDMYNHDTTNTNDPTKQKPIVVYGQYYKALLQMLSDFSTKYSSEK